MARYAYDLNRTTRFIDVHKQFNGGLKTVDTDDALGAVFLRDAQNVSLSEFGFIEKRYGTYLNSKEQLSGNFQGYFEFKGYKIYAINNTFYVNGNPVTEILKENEDEWRYPTLPLYPFQAVNDEYRDMNAVNINDVLYIFTGYYPVYAKVVEGELKFYWFSVDIPTYDEIVVVGHNLLEDDYEELYFPETFKDLATPSEDVSLEEKIAFNEADFIPKIPFASEDGKIDLKLSYKYQGLGTFNYGTPYSDPQQPDAGLVYDKYYQLKLDRVDYRSSGAGASTLDYLTFEEDSVTHSNDLDNLGQGELNPQLSFEGYVINKAAVAPNEFTRTDGGGADATYYHAYAIELEKDFPRSIIQVGDVFNLEFFKTTLNPNSPFEKVLWTDFQTEPPGISIPDEYENVLTLEITPYDSEGSLFEGGKISLTPDTSSGSYVFKIPSTVSVSDFVFGYRLYFRYGFVDDVIQVGAPYALNSNQFFYSLSKTLEASEFDKFTDHNFLTISLTNLLSGIYDIRPVYKLEEYNYTGGDFELNSTTEISYTFSNINITAEKLQDYPGSEGVAVQPHPIWSCNKVIEHFNKLMVWGSLEMKNSVFYSFPDRPTYFPQNFYLDFGNDTEYPVEAVMPFMNILVVQTPDVTWGVRGNSGLIDAPAPYIPFTINTTVGTIAYKSLRPVRNHLYFLSKQGIVALKSLYAADEQYNIDFVDRNIKNIVPQDKQAVGIQYDNQYWLNFPNFGITLRWYIDKKAWVKDVFAWGDAFKGVHKWQIDNGKLEFISYPSELQEDTNPYIYKIGIDESLPADMGSNVITKFETSFLNQNHPFHQKNYKEFKYDFTMQNEYNFSREPIYDKTFDIPDEVTVLGLQASDLVEPLLRNHTYMLSFSDVVEVDTIEIDGVLIENLVKYDGSYYLDGNTDYFFTLPNTLNGKLAIDIKLTTPLQGLDERVSLRDTTYDETMVFLSKIITEERNVINQQLPIGYAEEQEAMVINLADFQDFTLGTTFFGDRVTFVKTIKLSGKGYNTKAYFEDESKAKWTIESMGITYKMKRARSD